MGAIGGSLFHGIKGARNAPKGFNRRLIGSLAFIKEKAPVTGESTELARTIPQNFRRTGWGDSEVILTLLWFLG